MDIQYYKSEENLQIIEKIREKRPDLIESIVFVINKADKLRERDGTGEELINRIKGTLSSWNVGSELLYLV
ncbi:hypothetical protein JQK62_26170, partial [Leptospira santarosai]|nr:hypothetical protein [Leptospira santarosai]